MAAPKSRKVSGQRVKKNKRRPKTIPARSAAKQSSSRDAGHKTLQEILSQPATWLETARRFEPGGELFDGFHGFSKDGPWLFVACGSSYYLSRTIAAQW